MLEPPDAVLQAAFGFLAGLLAGSFLNVCIYRWPRNLSVVRPRSHCPACSRTIAWYDNIPLVSYLILRARCRHCRAPIPLRYLAVELLTGLLFGWFVSRFGLTVESLRLCAFAAILITLGITDVETRILPDEFTKGGLAAGLLLAAYATFSHSTPDSGIAPSLLDSAIGAALPSGLLWLGGEIFKRVRHKEGLGFGDVKMTAMIGAFTGLQGALLSLVIGTTLGTAAGLLYIALARKDAATYELPLGTFLAIGGIIFSLFGPQLLRWTGAA